MDTIGCLCSRPNLRPLAAVSGEECSDDTFEIRSGHQAFPSWLDDARPERVLKLPEGLFIFGQAGLGAVDMADLMTTQANETYARFPGDDSASMSNACKITDCGEYEV